MQTVRHLADRARGAGAEIREGVEVVGFELGESGVEAIATERRAAGVRDGRRRAGAVDRPASGACSGSAPTSRWRASRGRWCRYWKAQEGEFALRGVGLGGGGPRRAGRAPRPERAAALRSRRPRHWSPGPGGSTSAWAATASPAAGCRSLLTDPELDPYGFDNPAHVAEPEFAEFFVSGLATALRRFRGRADDWRSTPGGGIVPHTPDNYPVCDWVLPNVYAIVDSGHGFKTLAVGRLAADDMLDGGEPLLDAFRLDRFAQGATHAASMGPYPWT